MKSILIVIVVLIAAASASLVGRWVPADQLGVINIFLNGSDEYAMYSDMRTSINEWKAARATFDSSSRVLTVVAVKAFNSTIWRAACHQAALRGSLGYPILHWLGSCSGSSDTVQSMAETVEWHRYGSDLLCRQDHPMGTTRVQNKWKPPAALFDDQARRNSSAIRRIHVVFTQHFDLGYTDFASCVLNHYFWYILPGAALTAEQLPQYRYTTQPYILYTFFNCESLVPLFAPPPGVDFVCPSPSIVKLVTAAIVRGQIVWHAFPFDGFNEMLGLPLYRHAVKYSKWLAERFPSTRTPTVVQQVDVPGLFGVQVQPMLEAGVRAVYVGQNGQPIWAGALTNLPKLFAWKPATVNVSMPPLLVLSHELGYGGIGFNDITVDEESGAALLVMCTLENRPSETPQTVLSVLKQISAAFPSATAVLPSTYDDFVDEVMAAGWPRPTIPVVTADIGDSWVRSSAGDPVKNAAFLNLRRSFEDCVSDDTCPTDANTTMAAALFIMAAAEHNGGLPMIPDDWEAVAASYEEKRRMVTSAASLIPMRRVRPSRQTAKSGRGGSAPWSHVCRNLVNGSAFSVTFGTNGAITHLSLNNVSSIASHDHTLLDVVFAAHNTTSPTWGDPNRDGVLLESHLTNVSVALLEESASGCLYRVTGVLNQTFYDPSIRAWRSPRNRNSSTGERLDSLIPTTIDSFISAAPKLRMDSLVSVVGIGSSDANGVYHSFYSAAGMYLGTSLSVGFNPAVGDDVSWEIEALGQNYSPNNFLVNGTCHMHLADSATASGAVTIQSIDAPLLLFGWNRAQWQSVQDPQDPRRCLPDVSEGIWWNLYNSWNANWCVAFPWNDEDGVTAPLTFAFSLVVN